MSGSEQLRSLLGGPIDINDCIDYTEVVKGLSTMASITIRNLPDDAKEALSIHAAKAGISLEAYAREVLHAAARDAAAVPTGDLLSLSRSIFGDGRGVDLELSSRRSHRPAVGFGS